MSYAPFEPLPPVNTYQQEQTHIARKLYKQKVIDMLKLIPLKNMVLGMSSYYLEPTTNFIWEFDNSTNNGFFKPVYPTYQHLLTINNLSNSNYDRQHAFLLL